MTISLSHRGFVFLLKLTGGRKILGKQFAKGVSATAAPKAKDMARYSITKSEFKDLPIWTYAGDDTLIYYLHGGGFVLGFSPLYFSMMGKIAQSSGATLVAPDYPLPPDASAMETHGWMRAHFMETIEALKPKRVIIMGDSAGGNLAIIFTGDQDLLHPDIIRFAAKHPKAQLDIANDMPHVYMLMPTKEAKAAIERIGAVASQAN